MTEYPSSHFFGLGIKTERERILKILQVFRATACQCETCELINRISDVVKNREV